MHLVNKMNCFAQITKASLKHDYFSFNFISQTQGKGRFFII